MTTTLQEQLQASLGSSYTVERELGGGGMSRVFLAHEQRLGRKVVVKVLSPELAAEVSAERFEREARTAAKLQDPRIVPVLSSGEAAGLPFYTMPYVDGLSLRERIAEGPIPLASAISILRDVALALEYAHEHGIIHRDIKPENVLIAGRGHASTGTAMVTDFGISKALANASTTGGGLTLTQQGATIGTPAYMAPEQASGDVVDARADLYAWGVMAYEMLAGAHPFADRTTAGALVAAHIRDTPPPLSTQASGLPVPLVGIVEQTLAKDPMKRPASAGVIVQALDAAVSAPARVRRTASMRTWAVAVVGVIAVAVAVVTLVRRARETGATNRAAVARAIAVLPFKNAGADSDAYFAEGMSDELSTALGRLSTVRVASRTAAARYRDATAGDAGRALKVDAVLTGTVRRSGAQLRINTVLTNATDGTETWSQAFNASATNVFDMQDQIARAIVDSLRVALTGASASVARAPRGTRDLEAYNLYLKGRYAWSRRGTDLLSAVKDYRAAIARDTSFARAYAGLAMAYTPMLVFGVGSSDSVLPLAEASALHALRLDSTLAEAHLALANVRKMQWQWEEAGRHFQAAIAYSPDDATAHQWYGTYLYSLGRVDDAAEQLVHARDLDPVSPALGTDVTYGLYVARRFDEALAEARRTVALDSSLAISHWLTGLVLLALDRPDSALRALETARRLGSTPDSRAALVKAYRMLGRTREADATYASLARSYAADSSLGRDLASAAVTVGDAKTALAAVKRTIARREPMVTEYSLPCDPLLDPLKSEPEFIRVLTQVGMQPCPAAR